MDTIINFSHVDFRYGGEGDYVLRDVSLAFRKGESVAILGHNGSGKSTLCKMTNGFLLPERGSVTVNGLDTKNEETLMQIRQTVGLVFQNPDNQIVATVVEEDVAFAPENLGVPSPEIRARVDQALRAVGMYAYRDRAPHRLSGGQKQRVAIAGALAMHPEVLVLDEPTAMLDPAGRDEVMQTVLSLAATGVTVLMITHHMNEAALFDRVLVLDRGQPALDGSPGEVFLQYDRLRELRLTVPQTVELARRLGVTDTAPLTVEACARALYERYQRAAT